ncbi:MAG: T9SS type A sorting domain-containing protein [Chitinophagales bacterium]
MKVGILICSIFISNLLYSQWNDIYMFEVSDDGNDFKDLEVTDDGVLYAARVYVIMRSFDLGLTWDTAYYNEEQGDYRRIMFVNSDTGYIVKGYGPGLFIRTTDGGDTWETVTPMAGGYSERANNIFYFDYNNLLFPVSDGVDGFIVITTNAGLTSQNYYTLPGEDGVADIYCFSNDSCITIPGDPYGPYSGLNEILLTTNGCEDWSIIGYMFDGMELQVPSPDAIYIRTYFHIQFSGDRGDTRDTLFSKYTGGGFSELYMLNDSVGFAAFYKAGSESEIYRTDNMGMNWTLMTIDPPAFGGIKSIDCFDEEHCYMIAGITLYTTSERINVISTDLHEFGIQLSPNPALDFLKIDLNFSAQDLAINTFNMVGEVIELQFQNNQASVSHLPPGIYFTQVITEQGRAVQKWVKM